MPFYIWRLALPNYKIFLIPKNKNKEVAETKMIDAPEAISYS